MVMGKWKWESLGWRLCVRSRNNCKWLAAVDVDVNIHHDIRFRCDNVSTSHL